MRHDGDCVPPPKRKTPCLAQLMWTPLPSADYIDIETGCMINDNVISEQAYRVTVRSILCHTRAQSVEPSSKQRSTPQTANSLNMAIHVHDAIEPCTMKLNSRPLGAGILSQV